MAGELTIGEVTTDRPSWLARLSQAAWLSGTLFGWSVCGVGIALHGLVGDRWPIPWCFVYYALPRPVLCLAAAASLMSTPRAFPRCVALGRIILVVLLAWVLFCDLGWRWPNPTATEPKLRVAVWNACHLVRGRESAASVIRSLNADLVGLVEAGNTESMELAEWERLLPEYRAASNRAGMLWLSRLPSRIEPAVHIGPRSDAVALEFEWNGRPCRAVLADICADFSVVRVPLLAELSTQLREKWVDRPWLLLGDFNAPPESVGFADLRRRGVNVFSARGSGYAPTWPVPLPVLTLDQIWADPVWQLQSCRHHWTTCSDHRPVVVDLTIATITPVAESPQ